MKRICILALDALEYDLVEEFDLKNIKQLEYGKIDVSMFKDLITPIVWGSFISGLPPEKHGLDINAVQHWHSFVIDKLRYLSIKMKLDQIKNKGRILERLGFERKFVYDEMMAQFKNRKIKTFFDIVPKAKAFSVPPYQKWIERETQQLFSQAMQKNKIKPFEQRVWNIFEQKRNECIKIIQEGNWNLFMAHFMFTDLLAHFYVGNLTKMFGIYLKAEELVEDVKKIIGDETLLLVVSDHGMKTFGKGIYGDHSDHGFYSSNVQLNLVNPKVTDFFDLVVKTLT